MLFHRLVANIAGNRMVLLNSFGSKSGRGTAKLKKVYIRHGVYVGTEGGYFTDHNQVTVRAPARTEPVVQPVLSPIPHRT